MIVLDLDGVRIYAETEETALQSAARMTPPALRASNLARAPRRVDADDQAVAAALAALEAALAA